MTTSKQPKEGLTGTLAGIPVRLTINSYTGRVDMSVEEVNDFIAEEITAVLDEIEEANSFGNWKNGRTKDYASSSVKEKIAEIRARINTP